MDQLKTVKLSGTAASDFTGGKKSRRSTKRKQEGGSANAESVPHIDLKGIECPTSVAHSAGSANPATWLAYPRGAPVPPAVHPVMFGGVKKMDHPSSAKQETVNATSPVDTTDGGTRHIKVELKKRISSKKVQLHPKKIESIHAKNHQTKKARKLTIGLSSFRKRMTRAKKLHKRMSTMPLAELKAHLISKKLIKPTSKAPESVLRQIAADSQIVNEKSL
jgi:hypothetical protein